MTEHTRKDEGPVHEKRLVRFDWAMKHMLRNKANFCVLEGFLSGLLKENITIKSLLESESNKDSDRGKFNRVDLVCSDSQGRTIIIEVQTQREYDYLERIAWGASKALVESIELGDRYGRIAKVISVSILYFSLTHEGDDYIYHGATEFRGLKSGLPVAFDLKNPHLAGECHVQAHNVMPEYYLIDVERFSDNITDAVDEWAYFFKHGKIRDSFSSPGILVASAKLDYLSMSERERKDHDDYVISTVIERDVVETALMEAEEKGRAKGIEEGKAEGIAEGMEKGIAEGMEKGIAEAKAEMIRAMLASGMSPDAVAAIAGTSVQDVERHA